MTLYEEEKLFKELSKSWESAAENEDLIRSLFSRGIPLPSDLQTINFLCMIVLGELCYRRKSWLKEEK